jgi:hypothetical protein
LGEGGVLPFLKKMMSTEERLHEDEEEKGEIRRK